MVGRSGERATGSTRPLRLGVAAAAGCGAGETEFLLLGVLLGPAPASDLARGGALIGHGNCGLGCRGDTDLVRVAGALGGILCASPLLRPVSGRPPSSKETRRSWNVRLAFATRFVDSATPAVAGSGLSTGSRIGKVVGAVGTGGSTSLASACSVLLLVLSDPRGRLVPVKALVLDLTDLALRPLRLPVLNSSSCS